MRSGFVAALAANARGNMFGLSLEPYPSLRFGRTIAEQRPALRSVSFGMRSDQSIMVHSATMYLSVSAKLSW